MTEVEKGQAALASMLRYQTDLLERLCDHLGVPRDDIRSVTVVPRHLVPEERLPH